MPPEKQHLSVRTRISCLVAQLEDTRYHEENVDILV